MDNPVTLIIDGKSIEVAAGTTVLQACEELAIEVPVFCYHPRLAIAGNCRMCLVEIEKVPKPVASCAMPVSEGMIVHTKSHMVEKARNGVLEFLLINHPLDCPVCDQGGECDLQDITMNYARGSSRYEMNKRAVPEKYMGPLIKTMMNRCIHCTRCIRFANEVAGIPEVGALHRGEHTEITTLENAVSSELSGNMIDICPVGALTSKPYAFHGRPWELKKTDAIDVLDAVGSNIRIDSKGNKVMRILPRVNEAINEEWISDKTRFSYDGLANQRLDKPYKRISGKLQPCTWEEAFALIKEKFATLEGNQIASLTGDLVDVESTYALKLLLDKLGCPNRDCRQNRATYSNGQILNRAHYLFNTTIEGLEKADVLLLIGTNPRLEAPLINARIRKRSLLGGFKIGLVGPKIELTYPYQHLGDSPQSLFSLFEKGNPFYNILKEAHFPAIILGQSCFTRDDTSVLLEYWQKLLDTFPQLIQDSWNGYNVLHTAAGRVGGLDVGFVPSVGGLSTTQILESCMSGSIQAIYALGVDEIDTNRFGDAFVVYQGHHGDKMANRADVILPGATYAEKSATFVNTEGRVQQHFAAILPPGEAREDWTIIRALSEALEQTLPFNTLDGLRDHLEKDYPWFRAVDQITKPDWITLNESLPNKTAKSLSDLPFIYPVTNPYMTCTITRHSKTMASCVQEILNTPKKVINI